MRYNYITPSGGYPLVHICATQEPCTKSLSKISGFLPLGFSTTALQIHLCGQLRPCKQPWRLRGSRLLPTCSCSRSRPTSASGRRSRPGRWGPSWRQRRPERWSIRKNNNIWNKKGFVILCCFTSRRKKVIKYSVLNRSLFFRVFYFDRILQHRKRKKEQNLEGERERER